MKDDVVNTQELLSALVDGELTGPELEQALALAEDAQGQANWPRGWQWLLVFWSKCKRRP